MRIDTQNNEFLTEQSDRRSKLKCDECDKHRPEKKKRRIK